MLPRIIEYLKNKSVLILGFGREGQSTLNYIRKYLPEKEITVSDKNSVTVDDKNVKITRLRFTTPFFFFYFAVSYINM